MFFIEVYSYIFLYVNAPPGKQNAGAAFKWAWSRGNFMSDNTNTIQDMQTTWEFTIRCVFVSALKKKDD